MLKNLMQINSDPLLRRFDSSEFRISVLSLIFISVIAPSLDFLVVGLSVILDGYIISRTLFKANRWKFSYSGFKSSEGLLFALLQVIVFALAFLGAQKRLCLVTLAINQALYSICRGIVKQMPDQKGKAQILNL